MTAAPIAVPPPWRGTEKQEEARALLAGFATHILLDGGARSGKTFLFLRCLAARALMAPGSRHAVLRFRFNHLVASVLEDTWPKMLDICWPGLRERIKTNRTAWFDTLPNGSQVWWGGLDERERVEKILGSEFATIYLNECSQIPHGSREVAITRLAQRVEKSPEVGGGLLPLRMYYDANPPKKSHWLYRLFYEHRDPESREPLNNPADYAAMTMNPEDNAGNLAPAFLDQLRNLSGARRRRFYEGRYGESAPGALFDSATFDKWRVLGGEMPDMQRVVVAVDPSGAGDDDAETHNAIGIVVCGLGVDGNAYVLEDLTLTAGPAQWGRVAASAYERHAADRVVAETNYGGAMVEAVIQAARPGTPFEAVKASRGKVVRAEPVSALYEDGKVRHVGMLTALEDELAGFTDTGYTGEESPNRADALVWGITALFPSLTRRKPREQGEAGQFMGYKRQRGGARASTAWVA